jgi:C4-dicarboxylate-binding protein DctP
MCLKIIGLFFFLLLQTVPGQAESISILIGSQWSAETPEALATEYLRRLLEERSAGRLQVTIEEGKELVGQEILKALRNQQLQIALLSVTTLETALPNLSIYNLPFLFHDRRHLHQVIDGQSDRQINHTLSSEALKPLAIWDGAADQLLSAEKLPAPDSRTAQALFAQKSGGNWLETSLAGVSQQLPRQKLSVLTLTGHRFSVNVLLTHERFWERLPEDLQVIAESAIKDATSYARELAEQTDQTALASLRSDSQLTILSLPAAQRASWEETMQKIFRASLDMEKQSLIAIITDQVTN